MCSDPGVQLSPPQYILSMLARSSLRDGNLSPGPGCSHSSVPILPLLSPHFLPHLELSYQGADCTYQEFGLKPTFHDIIYLIRLVRLLTSSLMTNAPHCLSKLRLIKYFDVMAHVSELGIESIYKVYWMSGGPLP